MKINPFVIIFLSSSSSFESVSAETIRRGENVIHRQTNQAIDVATHAEAELRSPGDDPLHQIIQRLQLQVASMEANQATLQGQMNGLVSSGTMMKSELQDQIADLSSSFGRTLEANQDKLQDPVEGHRRLGRFGNGSLKNVISSLQEQIVDNSKAIQENAEAIEAIEVIDTTNNQAIANNTQAIALNTQAIVDNDIDIENNADAVDIDIAALEAILDGASNLFDNCPTDPNKTEVGICGCGVSDEGRVTPVTAWGVSSGIDGVRAADGRKPGDKPCGPSFQCTNYWLSDTSNSTVNDQWLQLDFDKVYQLEKVTIDWASYEYQVSVPAEVYDIEVSDDGVSFTSVFRKDDGVYNMGIIDHIFTVPVSGRYVRMHGEKMAKFDESRAFGYGIHEMEVYSYNCGGE